MHKILIIIMLLSIVSCNSQTQVPVIDCTSSQRINMEFIPTERKNLNCKVVVLNDFFNETVLIFYFEIEDTKAFLSNIETEFTGVGHIIRPSYIPEWLPENVKSQFYKSKKIEGSLETKDKAYGLGNLKVKPSDDGFIIVGKNYALAMLFNR